MTGATGWAGRAAMHYVCANQPGAIPRHSFRAGLPPPHREGAPVRHVMGGSLSPWAALCMRPQPRSPRGARTRRSDLRPPGTTSVALVCDSKRGRQGTAHRCKTRAGRPQVVTSTTAVCTTRSHGHGAVRADVCCDQFWIVSKDYKNFLAAVTSVRRGKIVHENFF